MQKLNVPQIHRSSPTPKIETAADSWLEIRRNTAPACN